MELNQMLEKVGIAELNTMQQAALKTILEERNTTLLSPTGSGKTLAFLLPLYQLMDKEKSGVQSLILSPTRELAIQIEKVWQKMGTGYKVSTCYGGHPFHVERNNLTEAPALLIGTPGRVLEHIQKRSFDTTSIRMLVLDEFDKSLTLGFKDQMYDIIRTIHQIEKRVLVSATNKLEIPEFVGMEAPVTLNFTEEQVQVNSGFDLRMITAPSGKRDETLFRLLCALGEGQSIIFCNMRDTTESVATFLGKKGLDVACFHGGLDQLEREKALIRFRNASASYLITSDLAARGLDIPEVKNVIHYDKPSKQADFLHRNGRTARMHAAGTAILMVDHGAPLPAYMETAPPEVDLPPNILLPAPSVWNTIYISGGKKDKLSKVDIVGFMVQKGGIAKDDIGRIEILDFMAFVAVKKALAEQVLLKVREEKMKGKKYKMNLAW